MNDLERRIEKLERSNRRYRALGGLAILLLAAGMLMGAVGDDKVQDVVTAKKYKLVNDDGTVIGLLGAYDGKPMLSLDGGGETRIILAVGDSDDASLSFVSRKGKPLVTLMSHDGRGFLSTHNENGKYAAILGAAEDGHGYVKTYNGDGKELVILAGTGDGGSVSLFNKTGEPIIALVADKYGNGNVAIMNREGGGRIYDSQ